MQFADDYLRRAFAGEETLLFDGALGTMIQKEGLLAPGAGTERVAIDNPAGLTAIHRAYAQAGAQVGLTNTFSCNGLNLTGEVSVSEAITAAVACARDSGVDYVALDIGPLGQFLDPYGDIEEDEAYELFAEQVAAGVAAGVDMIMVETMFDVSEARIAVEAAVAGSDVPVIVSLTFNETGRTMFGHTPAKAVAELIPAGASAIGANCSVGPEALGGVAQEFLAAVAELEAAGHAPIPVIMQPNAGLPKTIDGQQVYDMTPQEFAAHMSAFAAQGVKFVGSCCGSTPEFTAAIAAVL